MWLENGSVCDRNEEEIAAAVAEYVAGSNCLIAAKNPARFAAFLDRPIKHLSSIGNFGLQRRAQGLYRFCG